MSVDIAACCHHCLCKLEVPIGTGAHEAGPAIFGLRSDACSHGKKQQSYPDVALTASIVECCQTSLQWGGRGGWEGGFLSDFIV